MIPHWEPLDSVSIVITPTATFRTTIISDATYKLYFDGIGVSSTPFEFALEYAGPGSQVTMTFTQVRTDAPSLAFFSNGNPAGASLAENGNIGASATFEGTNTVTYDYTPAVQPPSGVPEAPSIAILSVGLLALGWTLRQSQSANRNGN